MLDLNKLSTETRNPETRNLDRMTPREIVAVMNREDNNVVKAISEQLDPIAAAAEAAASAFRRGGRLIYLGAGTSGRLGVLDAVECVPTFGVPDGMVIGLIAGGEKAFVKAVEGSEDSPELAGQDLKRIQLSGRDVVVGIAASGRTPYVIGGMEYAREMGCTTVGIACNRNALISQKADIAIEVVAGPEVLTGSTRLKAGTCQKMILNMISTASMVGIGKAYENLMVDVLQTNEKLHVRAQNIVMQATGAERGQAADMLDRCGGSAKLAITALLLNLSPAAAKEKLANANGKVYQAIQQAKGETGNGPES